MSLRSLLTLLSPLFSKLLYLSPKLMRWRPYAGDLRNKSLLYLKFPHFLPLCFLSLLCTFILPTSKKTVIYFPSPMHPTLITTLFTCSLTSSITLSMMCIVSYPWFLLLFQWFSIFLLWFPITFLPLLLSIHS